MSKALILPFTIFLALSFSMAAAQGEVDPARDASADSASPDEPAQRGQPEADEPDQDEEQRQLRVDEYVFVEDSLPYVPSSNTIVTKLPLSLRQTPNNVGIVTEPLAREQFDRVLGDALVNVSNVNIQTQNGVHDFFLIRGFDSLSSGLVLTDGASEPEATFYQLYNVQLVEVLKGPGGFLYGSNPLAGAVNLVRKQPAPAGFIDFGATAGSFDNYEGSFDWNHGSPDGSASFRLNGLVRDRGSHREGKGGTTAAVNPTFAWRFGDASRLSLSFEYVRADFTPDSGIPVLGNELAPVGDDAEFQSPFDTSEQDVFRFQADYEARINDWLTVRDKFYRRDLDWLSNGTLYNGVLPTGPASFEVARTLILLDDRQAFTGNQLEAIFSFETGGARHSLLTGFELARFADTFTLDVELLPSVDLFDPVEPPGARSFPIPGASSAGDSRSIVAAPYIIDQVQFGERLHVLFGGRIDTIDFADEATGTERADTELSPMLGVLVSPERSLSLYASFSRAFAPPSARVVGEIVPERGTQYEAGIKKRFARLNAETTVAVYQLERDNIPIPDDNGFTQQAGNQRSRGFELDFAAQPSPGLRGFFSYAFNDAELTNFTEIELVSLRPLPTFATLDRSGNRPAFAPRHIFNFWVSKDLSSSWGVGGGGRYVGGQFIAEDNGFILDDVLTFDAMVFYRIGDFKLRLNLKNITDRQFYLRGFGGSSVIPAPPFAAFFGFDYEM